MDLKIDDPVKCGHCGCDTVRLTADRHIQDKDAIVGITITCTECGLMIRIEPPRVIRLEWVQGRGRHAAGWND